MLCSLGLIEVIMHVGNLLTAIYFWLYLFKRNFLCRYCSTRWCQNTSKTRLTLHNPVMARDRWSSAKNKMYRKQVWFCDWFTNVYSRYVLRVYWPATKGSERVLVASSAILNLHCNMTHHNTLNVNWSVTKALLIHVRHCASWHDHLFIICLSKDNTSCHNFCCLKSRQHAAKPSSGTACRTSFRISSCNTDEMIFVNPSTRVW